MKYKLTIVHCRIIDYPLKNVYCSDVSISVICQFAEGHWQWNFYSLYSMERHVTKRDLVTGSSHDDVIKRKHFPSYRPFVRGIQRSPINSPHKGQWRGALIFSLICALNKRLSKQLWGWWFKTPSRSLWCHCNAKTVHNLTALLYGVYARPNVFGTCYFDLSTYCMAWCPGAYHATAFTFN